MISHYLKLAGKNIAKNKYYTLINVFGLVCGMLSALIIAKYIGGSLDFDGFHTRKERTFSVVQVESSNGSPQRESNATYWGAGEIVKQYPEVVDITRYNAHVEALVQTDHESGSRVSFIENKIFVVDSAFFKIFTFPLVHGESRTALSRLNSVVLTSSTSKRYFGNTDPIGRVITIRVPWGQEIDYEITGVAQDPPKRSRFDFDFLVTQSPLDPGEFWTVPECPIFVLLKTEEEGKGLSRKIAGALDNVEQLKAANKKVTMSLESIDGVRLTNTEYLLAAVGIFIVLISWINYINQVIAQSYLRIRQIGILRVMGSTKTNLKTQFVVESALTCLTSLVIVVIIYLSLEPYLQSLTNGHLLPSIGDASPVNIVFLSIFFVGIALAAFIPGAIAFSQDFAATLRNGYGSKIDGVGLRRTLVVVQFSISTILMISIFIISDQLEYMRSKDKGISMESILIIKDPMSKDSTFRIKRKTIRLFKEKCAQLPFVLEATSSTTVPGESYRHETFLSFQDGEKKNLVHLTGVDDKFFGLYQVEFIAGHDFIPDARFENEKSIILSESAARAFGIFDLDKMIGAKIIDHEEGTVYDLIGIVKDYHQTSLKYAIQPMAFKFGELRGHFSLKINRSEGSITDQMSAIKRVWSEVYHDAAFDSFFLDEKFEAQDADDRFFGKLFQYFTGLSIVISCLGLFGLSLLISMRRNREVGIRKSFGASSLDILGTFLKSYLKPLVISVLTGAPVAYLLMTLWLRNYSYRIDIGFWPVCLAVISLMAIFLFTVSYHAIKSSRANPVEILKD